MGYNDSVKHTVRPVAAAFDVARATLGLNATAYTLNRDWRAQGQIITHMKEMGIGHVMNLTSKYADSAISIPFYAGDGIVAKVMRHSDYDDSNPIYNLPAISVDKVNTDIDTFIVATYPWIPGGFVPRDEIEQLRTKMQSVGLDFAENDDEPRNLHRMPDAHQTLIGIDAGMYTSAHNGKRSSPELEQAWRTYIETVFPIYKEGKIAGQTPDTNFTFRSIHDRESGIIGFSSENFLEEGKDPIIRAADKLTKETQSVWNKLFGWMSPKPDGHEPS